MFKFEHQGKHLEVLANNCFEPNLTTKIILSGAIKVLSDKERRIQHVIELGCGCGIISSYLLKYGYLNNVSSIGMSDLSKVAVEVAKTNIECHKINSDINRFEFKIGSGLEIWRGAEVDLVINDISAISDTLLPMTSWFDNAPNGAGIDGIENTVNVLRQFNEIMKPKSLMLLPVLSLSNVKLLLSEISKLNFNQKVMVKQAWPLPKKMVEDYGSELQHLRKLGHIDFVEKFGQYVVETACYMVWRK